MSSSGQNQNFISVDNELLPCPFCGAAADEEPGADSRTVVCCNADGCPAQPYVEHRVRAIAVNRWNNRAAPKPEKCTQCGGDGYYHCGDSTCGIVACHICGCEAGQKYGATERRSIGAGRG